MKVRTVVLTAILLSGCSSRSRTPDATSQGENPAVAEARATFPHFADVQTKLISSTCSPSPGVCHNSSNYPNLETAGNTITFIGAPCNTEIPNPLDGWDACEKPGHVLVAGTSGAPFRSAIAWIEQAGPGTWSVHLVDPAPLTQRTPVSFENADGSSFYDPPVLAPTAYDGAFSITVDLVQTSPDATVTVNTDNSGRREFADSILATVLGGDPNHNGSFGAANVSSSAAVVFPGDPSRSYLWRRITGTVPGSRMPLANAPLTLPDYIAIACWIEGLDAKAAAQAEDTIDYDSCKFAGAPIDYTVQ